METPEHQELRARQRVSPRAVVKTGLLVGFILFLMSGGGPWTTAGTMNVIVGRDILLPLPLLILFHFGLSLLYVWIIAHAIYRFRLGAAVAVGIGTTLGLYAVNYFIFHGFGFTQQSPEGRTTFVHVVFGLLASLLYKAFSVPKPLSDEPGTGSGR